MSGEALIGLWIVLGLLVVVMIVASLNRSNRGSEGEEHDIEHLDRSLRDDNSI